MKKTLLALAAIAATSASFAQSSVTLYGVLDASLESVKGATSQTAGSQSKTVTRVSSGNLATSRLGVKGKEDLGGGTYANFNLETGIFVDTGAQSQSNRFWNRQAWVGLAGSAGELRLGRTTSALGDAAGVISETQAYDELKVAGARAVGAYQYSDNALTYVLPTLVPGLSAQLQYTTANGSSKVDNAGTPGNETAGVNTGKAYGLGIRYVAGPLAAGVAYENIKSDYAATSPTNAVVKDSGVKANAALMYGSYDFGVAKVTAYYDAETNPKANSIASSTDTKRMTILGAKVAVPVSGEFTVVPGFAVARNVSGALAGNDNIEIFTVKGLYALSKRTTVYALLNNTNNGQNTFKSVDNSAPSGDPTNPNLTVAKAETSRGIAVGIVHSF